MIRNAIVSTIDTENRTARVILPETNYITSDLQISSNIIEIYTNDNVLVALLDNNVSQGMILENLTRKTIPEQNNSSDAHYTHNQITAESVWNIKHDLNKYPSVTTIDSAGSLVIGKINYVSSNEIKLTFSAAFSGTAYLN